MTTDNWPAIIRIIHLLGGLHAVNQPGQKVNLSPSLTGDAECSFQLSRYEAITSCLRAEGLVPIGIDFIETEEQLRHLQLPTWRVCNSNEQHAQQTIEQRWSEIRHAASLQKNFELADLAGRISFEFRASKFRLREISNSYYRELRARVFRKSFKTTQLSESRNTFHVYLAIHSFLNEICVLRNFFAEFIAAFIFSDVKTQSRVYSVSSLRSKILKEIRSQNPFAEYLWKITEANNSEGWLARLGEYRDLITHIAPLSKAFPFAGISTSTVKAFDHELPSMGFVLPDGLAELSRAREESRFLDPVEWIEANKEELINPSRQEALQYSFRAMNNMIDLGFELSERCPIAPEKMTLTEDDIVGPIKIEIRS